MVHLLRVRHSYMTRQLNAAALGPASALCNPPPFFPLRWPQPPQMTLTRPPSYLELTREAQALEALLQAKREEAGLLRQLRELDQKQGPGLRCGLRTPPKSKEVLGTVRMTTSGEEDENNPLTIKKQGYRPLKLECVKSAASLGPCPLYPAPFGIPE